mmetsp:Transcript_21384/g.37623  ORF Transcript_21384/g.37623 Transcript_21384/m.37623 type:complete len:232 (+) Transcript_21384:496-1191(+)
MIFDPHLIGNSDNHDDAGNSEASNGTCAVNLFSDVVPRNSTILDREDGHCPNREVTISRHCEFSFTKRHQASAEHRPQQDEPCHVMLRDLGCKFQSHKSHQGQEHSDNPDGQGVSIPAVQMILLRNGRNHENERGKEQTNQWDLLGFHFQMILSNVCFYAATVGTFHRNGRLWWLRCRRRRRLGGLFRGGVLGGFFRCGVVGFFVGHHLGFDRKVYYCTCVSLLRKVCSIC